MGFFPLVMAPKCETSEETKLPQNYPAEKSSPLVKYEESDNESSNPNEDSSLENSSTHEVLSPKKEDEVGDEETLQEKVILVPTKRGKKSKSSKYLIGFSNDLVWCKKVKWYNLLM